MRLIKIYNCKAITPSHILPDAMVIVKDGVIEEVTTNRIEITDAKEINGNGMYVSPGFIDLHTHGAGNHDFMDGSVEAIWKPHVPMHATAPHYCFRPL